MHSNLPGNIKQSTVDIIIKCYLSKTKTLETVVLRSFIDVSKQIFTFEVGNNQTPAQVFGQTLKSRCKVLEYKSLTSYLTTPEQNLLHLSTI